MNYKNHSLYMNYLHIVVKLILLLLCSTLVAFCLVSFAPIDYVQSYISEGDAISLEQRESMKAYLELDKNPVERYVTWLKNAIQLDFGTSFIYRKPVIDVLAERFSNSMCLMFVSWIASGVIGFFLGIVMGVQKNKAIDRILRYGCLALAAVPTFFLGMLVLLIFSVWLQWFPIGFSAPIGVLSHEVTLAQKLHHMVLPVLVLSVSSISNIALHTREKMIEVMQSDYIIFARVRGHSEREVVFLHGIRNIILPMITLQFASLSEIFGGSILAETVFSYGGLGTTVVDAGLKGDVPLLLGITAFSAVFVFTGNLIANVLYGVIDPKMGRGGRI